MSAEARENAELAMDEVMETISTRLTKIRTGKASPVILDGINVDYYGAPTPLNQLATVSAPEPRLLTVKPFDRSSIGAIDKAIQASIVGLNPASVGMMIRLAVPELTEDRRKALAKDARDMGEDGKIAIRKVRQEANDILKKEEKAGEITEDELHKDRDAIQELTDKYCTKIDDVIKAKQAEIMEL